MAYRVKFGHGGDVYSEGLLKGTTLIDFSSNVNPLGVPESFREHIGEALEAVTRYPDFHYRELKRNICKYLNKNYINEENLILGNGAAEVIDLAIAQFKSLMIVIPSFAEYEYSAKKSGANISWFSLDEEMNIDYGQLLRSLKRNPVEALIIANPNNPNGRVINKDRFRHIMDYCREEGIAIVIDEAFIEFTGALEHSFLDVTENYENILIIRALTKFFALPGIRFGYGISSNTAIINNIKALQLPWNINCFAEIAVKYVLKDRAYREESIKWINTELPYLKEQLGRLQIIDKVYETNCNFILCRLKEITDQKLYEQCMEQGISIRRASNFRGLDNRFVRFAVKDRESNDKLLESLKRVEVRREA